MINYTEEIVSEQDPGKETVLRKSIIRSPFLNPCPQCRSTVHIDLTESILGFSGVIRCDKCDYKFIYPIKHDKSEQIEEVIYLWDEDSGRYAKY